MPPATSPARMFLRAVSRSIDRSSIRTSRTGVGRGPDTPPPKTVAQLGSSAGRVCGLWSLCGRGIWPSEELAAPRLKVALAKKLRTPAGSLLCFSCYSLFLFRQLAALRWGGRHPLHKGSRDHSCALEHAQLRDGLWGGGAVPLNALRFQTLAAMAIERNSS